MALLATRYTNYTGGSYGFNSFRWRFDYYLDSQSTTNNTSTVRVDSWIEVSSHDYLYTTNTTQCYHNGYYYGLGTANIDNLSYGTYNMGSKTFTIYHNSDGTASWNVGGRGRIGSQAWWRAKNSAGSPTDYETFTLPTLNEKSTLTSSANVVLDGSTTNVYTISRKNSSNTHTLRWRDGSTVIWTASGIGTSYTMSTTGMNAFYDYMSTTKSLSVQLEVETSGGLGSNYYNGTATISNAAPTYNASVTYRDIDNVTGNNQICLSNLSTLGVTIPSVTLSRGASVSKREITFHGNTTSWGSSGEKNLGTVQATTTQNATVKTTDSRGDSVSSSVSVTVQNYGSPSGNVSVTRLNNYEAESYYTLERASYSSVEGNSVVNQRYRYRVTNGTWSGYTNATVGVTQTLTLDSDKSYEFETQLTDTYGETIIQTYVSQGVPILFMSSNYANVGIQRFPESSDFALHVGGDGMKVDGDDVVGIPRQKAYSPPNTAGSRKYIKLVTITANDSAVTFTYSGSGDYGSNQRGTHVLSGGIRNGTYSLRVNAMFEAGSDDPVFYYREASTNVMEIWVYDADYNRTRYLTMLHGRRGYYEINMDSYQTTAPSGLVQATEAGYVQKTGDTMSGNLTLPRVIPTQTVNDTTNVSSSTTGMSIYYNNQSSFSWATKAHIQSTSSTRGFQLAVEDSDNNFWFRGGTDTGWRSWEKIYHSGDRPYSTTLLLNSAVGSSSNTPIEDYRNYDIIGVKANDGTAHCYHWMPTAYMVLNRYYINTAYTNFASYRWTSYTNFNRSGVGNLTVDQIVGIKFD